MTNVVRSLFRELKVKAPQQSRDLAHKLKELWEAYPAETRAAIMAKSHQPFFPGLTIGSRKIKCLFKLIKAEDAELEIEACWKALDAGVPYAVVTRALDKAMTSLRASPQIDFAAELLTHLPASAPEPKEPPAAVDSPKSSAPTRETPPLGSPTPPVQTKAKAKATPLASHDRRQEAHWRRIATAMGAEEFNITRVIEGLTARGWMFKAKDLRAYISLVLSTNIKTKRFKRVKRGVYKVVPAVLKKLERQAQRPSRKPQAKAAARRTVPSKVKPDAADTGAKAKPTERLAATVTRGSSPRVDFSYGGHTAEWIIQRTQGKTQQLWEYFDRFIAADMQAVLSQLNSRSALPPIGPA